MQSHSSDKMVFFGFYQLLDWLFHVKQQKKSSNFFQRVSSIFVFAKYELQTEVKKIWQPRLVPQEKRQKLFLDYGNTKRIQTNLWDFPFVYSFFWILYSFLLLFCSVWGRREGLDWSNSRCSSAYLILGNCIWGQ